MPKFKELIYTQEDAPAQVISKAETHTPKIVAPDVVKKDTPFEVKVSVGPHEMKLQHSIRYVELWFYEEGRAFNPVKLATIIWEPEYTAAEASVKIALKKSGTLYAIAYCNLHGLWEARKDIKVQE